MARHPGKIYGHSTGRAPGQKHYYRKAFSGGEWDTFLALHAIDATLQVCCGGSQFGTVRVDIDRGVPGVNLVADMRRLPFKDRSFQTVACDPMYGLSMPDRVHLQRELARVARARIILKATWIPRATGWHHRDDLLTVICSHTCQNIGVLSVLERLPQTAKLEAVNG